MSLGAFEDRSETGSGKNEEQFVRLMVAGGLLRRRRIRKMILAHLLRERGEGGGDEETEESEEGFEGGGEGQKFAHLLIASGLLRRRRIRKVILAHLLRERGEEMEESGSEEGFGRRGGREAHSEAVH